MAGGYIGKILFVDLSEGKTWDEPLDESLCNDFMGGYGLGAKIIFDRQKPKVDPLGPEAMLGFVTGPLTGSPALTGSRYCVVGKSPLTGGWGDANSGGDFGPHLKFAGYDAVFIQGVSEKPVYLSINEGKAEIKEADHLWGKDSHDTEDMLQDDLGKDTRVTCIGPAGEKLSLISCVMNNKGRAAGRSGLGAVMGSKKLKAIAVNGNGSVGVVANEAEIKEARKKHLEEIHQSILYLSIGIGGTAGFMEFLHLTGEAPTKNWGGAALVDFADASPFYGQPMEELSEKKYGCWRCPISCGALMKAGTNQYKYAAGVHRPEYETLGSFGNMCLNNNPESVIAAADICNRHGIDTISAGTAIAFTIECYENGILTKDDTDGIEMTWGNHQSIVAMLEKLANREGFGDILADGVKVASEKIGKGSEKYAMHVGGQEPGLHDPRANMPYASAFIDATPGRHTQGSEGLTPLSGMPPVIYDPAACAGRGEIHKISVNLNNAANAAGICMFGYLAMDANAVHDFLNLVTGSNYTMDDVLKIGERIGNLRQAFNIREGVTTKDFKVPDRILGRPPLPDGPTAGNEVDLDVMRKDYFQAMDWDTESGKPSKTKLLEMGLTNVAEAIWP